MVSKVERIKIEDENNGNGNGNVISVDTDNNQSDDIDNSFEDEEQVMKKVFSSMTIIFNQID
jgi:hypothetical protein